MTGPAVTREEPRYDRGTLRPRVLHLGFGAFARAHTMWTLDRGLDARGGNWGVVAARLNSGMDALDALDAVNGRFHVAAADGRQATLRRIGCVIGTRHPKRDGPDALPDLIATATLALVTLTITEKGYCQSGGRLDRDRADVAADLRDPAAPRTAICVLVEGLARRRAAGSGPLTCLSCDNIPGNGHLLRRVVLDFAGVRDAELGAWIDANVAFPSSMVDRITPAMNEDGRALIRAALGRDDPNAIVAEPFLQWVVEDRFAAGRPPIDAGGAELVDDVTPFEEMKLRLLNGAHTFLAHAGRLAGHETVAGAMSDGSLRRAVRSLMLDEHAPTLHVPAEVDVRGYADALLDRFDNTRLQHRLAQIAEDTSQKVEQRLLAPLRANLEAGRPCRLGALAVASWVMAWRDLPAVPDPLGDEVGRAAASGDPVRAVLALPDLAPDCERLIAAVSAAFETMDGDGLKTSLAEALCRDS